MKRQPKCQLHDAWVVSTYRIKNHGKTREKLPYWLCTGNEDHLYYVGEPKNLRITQVKDLRELRKIFKAHMESKKKEEYWKKRSEEETRKNRLSNIPENR